MTESPRTIATEKELPEIYSYSDITPEEQREFGIEDKIIEEAFPDVRFVVCIKSTKLDDIIMDTNMIAIKCTHNCYCWDSQRPTEFYYCKKKNGFITNRDIIKCLEQNKYNPDCAHIFLERIYKVSDGQVKLWFGS